MTNPGNDDRAVSGWRAHNERSLAARGFPLPAAGDPSWRAEIAQEAGGAVVTVVAPDGRRIRLASERGSQRDADLMAEAACRGGTPPLVVVIGAGLGQVIEAVDARCPSARILVLEPTPCTLPHLLDRRDWRPLIDGQRLTILSGPDYAGAADAWRVADQMPERPPILVHPIVKREFPDLTDAARRVVQQIVFGARANREARQKLAGPYLLNTLRNLSTIAAESDVAALCDTMRGVPAVVVAAGPSLDRQMAALRGVESRAVVIAVDTALRPLLDAGIQPHLVVTIDPSDINSRHLQRLPDTSKTWLVAEGSMPPETFPPFCSRTFVFTVSAHQPWPWYAALGLQRGALKAWGSVLTSAVDLALRLGCQPILFAGADLAYTGGRPYCRGTTFERLWAGMTARGTTLADVWRSLVDARSPVEAADIYGDPTQTTGNLVAFRSWIVECTSSLRDRRFINTTPGGTLAGPNIAVQSLADALAGLPPIQDASLRRQLGEAWALGRAGTPGDVVPAAARDAAARGDELFAAWRAFSGNTVSDDDLADALASGCRLRSLEAVEPPTGQTVTPAGTSVPASFRPPERAAVLRAILRGEPWPGWVTDSVPGLRGRGRAAEAPAISGLLEDALARILRCAEEGAAVPRRLEATFRPGVPALAAVEWGAPADEIVSTVERCLTDAAWLAGPDGAPPHAPSTRQERRLIIEPFAPAAAGGGVSHVTPAPDTLVLWLLLEWLRVAAYCRPYASGTRPSPGPIESIEAFLESAVAEAQRSRDDATAYACVAVVSLQPGDRPVAHVPLTVEALQRLATGILVAGDSTPSGPVAHDGAIGAIVVPPVLPAAIRFVLSGGVMPRATAVTATARVQDTLGLGALVLEGTVLTRLQPTVLTGADLPRMSHPVEIGGGSVLAVERYGRSSWRIDADGRVSRASAWPGPVLGELPYGREGGAIAWDNGQADWQHQTAPCLWVRDTPRAEPHRIDIPFRPARAIVLRDGRVAWTVREGGIGVWSPEQGASVRGPGDTLLGFDETPDGVVGGRISLDAGGRISRTTPDRQRVWDPVTDDIRWGPPTPEVGPASCTLRDGAMETACHPLSGVIRVRRAGVPLLDLLCHEPLSVAWAGDALVVATLWGDLLLFPGFRAVVDGIA